MRHIKFYNESNTEFNLDFAISKIREEFSEDRVVKMFDDEWPNWVDDNWDESEYDSDLEWYQEHNNEEAQDVVYEEIISWFCKKFNKIISDKDRELLYNAIKNEYMI